ncbi:MAG: type IV / vi secretion system, dotu, partial [Variovorax sp.]
EADLARVAREVHSTAGVTAASFDIQLRVWPHCEVLAILKPYQARNHEGRHGLRIAAATAQNGRLREGDGVRVQVTNGDQAGHLRVDYYTADGAVMHLSAKGARLRAGETIEFGRDIPSSWLVSPPFGTVLMTALSSPLAFENTADRAPFELASDYLQRLRELLAANEAGGRLVADFMFLETVAR